MADPIEALDNNSNFLDINGFPDDIIILIFKKLPFSDICRCVQVCRRWFNLSSSVHLKEIVIHKHLKFEQLSLLIQNHFSQHLQTLKLLNETKTLRTCVKIDDLKKLRDKCPKIAKLVLRRCKLRSVSIDDLPKTIRCLSIRESDVPPFEFLKGSGDESKRPQLTCLDAARIRNCAYVRFPSKPLKSLRCLYLSDCPSIRDEFILSIAEVLPQLKILDVEGTGISDKGLRIILTHCVDVEELYIGDTYIDDDAIENLEIFTRIPKLSILCIRNTQFTNVFAELLSLALGNRVKLLKPFDPPVDGEVMVRSCEHLEFIEEIVMCDHYRSHACC